MKKTLFLSLILLTFSMSISAQIWLGGELAVKNNATSLGELEMNKKSSVEIMPEAGWNLSDKWAIGLQLGFSHFSQGQISIIDQTVTGNINIFSIKPFTRYTFYKIDKFSFFTDACIGFKSISISDYDTIYGIGITINPGLSYDINHKWSLVAHIGNTGYEHTWMKLRNETLKDDNFKLELFSGLSFGLFLKL